MNRALEIVALQALDDERATLETSLASVRERLESDPQLESARERLHEATEAQRAAAREQKRLEDAVATLTAKIEPEEKRLYDGSVRNPKDLQNIQAELDALKRQRSGLEDELLSAITAAETATEELAEAKESADREEERHSRENASLLEEQSRLEQSVARVDARASAQRSKIPPADLTLYDQLRRRKGQAVAKISGTTCTGCRVQVPDAMRRKALSTTSLAQCPNCERILYLG